MQQRRPPFNAILAGHIRTCNRAPCLSLVYSCSKFRLADIQISSVLANCNRTVATLALCTPKCPATSQTLAPLTLPLAVSTQPTVHHDPSRDDGRKHAPTRYAGREQRPKQTRKKQTLSCKATLLTFSADSLVKTRNGSPKGASDTLVRATTTTFAATPGPATKRTASRSSMIDWHDNQRGSCTVLRA